MRKETAIASSGMALPSTYFAPKSLRPQYDPSDDEPDDCVCVLSVGPPFRYVIPSFDILAIDMWQMRIKGYTAEGEERNYDIFIPMIPYSVNHIQCGWSSEMEQSYQWPQMYEVHR